jgi:hypothetical protein
VSSIGIKPVRELSSSQRSVKSVFILLKLTWKASKKIRIDAHQAQFPGQQISLRVVATEIKRLEKLGILSKHCSWYGRMDTETSVLRRSKIVMFVIKPRELEIRRLDSPFTGLDDQHDRYGPPEEQKAHYGASAWHFRDLPFSVGLLGAAFLDWHS